MHDYNKQYLSVSSPLRNTNTKNRFLVKQNLNLPSLGALLKTAFLCTKTVEFSSSQSLADQLKLKYGHGFEIHTWSHLPYGSGMGTSSILAGVVCAAIWKITSRDYDNTELLHLVVELEQKLTTGGGWQDQVGGLLGGVKITRSSAKLPIEVVPEILKVSNETLEKVKENMALIYTGKTRLAKDLLQVLPTRSLSKQSKQHCHANGWFTFFQFSLRSLICRCPFSLECDQTLGRQDA